MNGRDRMKIAMRREKPDRIPVMPQICYPHAVQVLCDDYRKGMARVIEEPHFQYELILEIAKLYQVDGVRLFVTPEPYKVVDDGELMVALDMKTGERVGRVDLLGGGAVIPDVLSLHIEDRADIPEFSTSQANELLDSRPYVDLKAFVAKAHQQGLFVASSPPPFTVNYLCQVRGREQAMMDMIVKQDLLRNILDAVLPQAIEHAKALVACGVDALYIGDPSASASLISPKHFEQFCLPQFRIFCDELHKTNVLIYLHICGNSSAILEMMADTGVDCIEPLDPLGGVSVADAKHRVGSRVALMGGVNTLTLLDGSPEQVYSEATRCCRAAGAEGGYILAAGDMVPDLAPQANVHALIEAAHGFTGIV